MQRYDKYKDSGIDWLGEIPEHWRVKKLKFLTHFVNRGTTPSYVENSEYCVVNQATFSKGVFDLKNIKFTNGSLKSYLNNKGRLLRGDLLIASTGGGVLGKVAIYNDEIGNFIADSHVTIVRTDFDNSSKYFYYFFSIHYLLINGVLAQGSTNQTELQRSWLLDFRLPAPPLQEQKVIVVFLDDKCEKIDSAVGLKEQQIEKLKELRQITIHNAVTRGVPRHAELAEVSIPMKDSGIDWIGEIPEHWKVKRLKNVLRERNERSRSGTEPLFMMSQIHGLVLRKDYHEKEEVAKSAEGNKVVYQNDLVFNKLKPHLGVFYKNKLDTMGIVSPDYAVYYSDTLDDIIFLEYLFRIPEYISQFKIKATGIVEGLIRLYTSDLFSIHIAIPPLYEQREIITYLEKQTSKIDKAIAQKQEQIIKFKEYKQSLINEVVTGKLKVID